MKLEQLPYVVIIEDNPDDSFWLKRELKKSRMDLPVKVFSSGQEALDFFSGCDFWPTAVFLDLHLPGVSGLALLNNLKANLVLDKLLVFVLDGSSSPQEIAECKELGVTEFLEKPVTSAALEAALIAHI